MHVLIYAALGYLGYRAYQRMHASTVNPPPGGGGPAAPPAPTPAGETPGDRNAVPEANQ